MALQNLQYSVGKPENGYRGKVQSSDSAVALWAESEEDKRYPIACSCGEHTVAVGGKIRKILAALTAQLIKQLFNKEDYIGTIGKMIAAEALELLSGLRSKFSATSAYTGPDLLALQLMEYNLFEFSASKTESRLAAMMRLLVDENNQIRSFAEFKRLCEKEVEKFNARWLEAEYNLSVAVGQTSAQYLRFMAEKDTVTSFVKYQTAGDRKVRDAHRALDGKIFNLSDKEAMDLWPPNGFGCRCEMVQYLGNPGDKVTKGSTAKQAMQLGDKRYKGSQFEINRGDLKQVFTKKQFYSDIKGLPEKLNQMTYDKYGLQKWEDFKDDLKPIRLDKSINGKNVKELFKPLENSKRKMGFEDYLGRKMVLDKSDFNRHTSGKYISDEEQRHILFPHVADILKNPSEVWLSIHDKKGFQTNYIKHYKDMSILVSTTLNEEFQGLKVETWFAIDYRKPLERRKGLLIKKAD